MVGGKWIGNGVIRRSSENRVEESEVKRSFQAQFSYDLIRFGGNFDCLGKLSVYLVFVSFLLFSGVTH